MTQCLGAACAIALGTLPAATAALADPVEMAAPVMARSGQGVTIAAAFARRWRRSKMLYHSGEHNIAQISPTILRDADLSLGDDRGPPCAAKRRRHSALCPAPGHGRAKGLADALLEAPSPATEQILRDIGIPAIKDVPPIVILRGGRPAADAHSSDGLR